MNKMAYLGPNGTFCEEAALRYNNSIKWELESYPTIEQVFAAVHLGKVDSGIVPIENSCEGSVNQTMDLLAYDYDLKLSGEIVLPIKHNLLARAGTDIDEISRIISHPQALAQCRGYLTANFNGLDLTDVSSTAEAARRVADADDFWAAIGTATAARAYGLEILESDIQDRLNNETRFIVLSSDCSVESDVDDSSCLPSNSKTSVLLYLKNNPGALFRALEQFYRHEINLTKIESRPAKTRIGEYLFFIDIEGHLLDLRVKKALAGLKALTHDIRVLGSYQSAPK